MADILVTRYIFIDTSVFEGENFLEGNKINKLFDFGNQGHIEIVLPEITRREVVSRMRKNLRVAKNYVEQHRRDIYKHTNILRNIETHKSRFPLPDVNIRKDAETMEDQFKALLLRGKASIINNTVDYTLIFEKYFSDHPPFHKESKKHEFPDAFALAVAEEWCKEKDVIGYFLSNDKDMQGYQSRYLIVDKDLPGILNLINRHIREKKRLENIARTAEAIKLGMDLFNQQLFNLLEKELRRTAYNLNKYSFSIEDVTSIDITGIGISGYSILSVDDQNAHIEMRVSFDFLLEYEGVDRSGAVYSNEDNEWFGEKHAEESIEGRFDIPVDAIVIHTHADGSAGNEVVINSINNDADLDIEKFF